MGFFQKLFGKDQVPQNSETEPDNNRLIKLIHIYNKTNQSDDYKKVLDELITGNSFLLLPSVNDGTFGSDWKTLKKGTTLNLTSVYNVDGLKVLGAFTSESTLENWAKQGSHYTAMVSKDVISFCEENQIDRVVIDNDTDTFFVLERNRENIKTVTIEKDTQVQLGTPSRPLNSQIIRKLNDQFKRVSTIKEVYQYGQTRDGEFSIVLGFKLSIISENSRTAAINSVQSALKDEAIDQLLDLCIITDEGWYNTIKGIENSLIYNKS
ncbi:SseB family protein [Flavobacterium psychrotrophum]|uniref:SseB family protein n=1 Tax=Flavobacterium psychrotrophum TaxID=2294119 RepID=UPI000E31C3D1|nr:SseB family protein [Flavobacterium psychrotrophum]